MYSILQIVIHVSYVSYMVKSGKMWDQKSLSICNNSYSSCIVTILQGIFYALSAIVCFAVIYFTIRTYILFSLLCHLSENFNYLNTCDSADTQVFG